MRVCSRCQYVEDQVLNVESGRQKRGQALQHLQCQNSGLRVIGHQNGFNPLQEYFLRREGQHLLYFLVAPTKDQSRDQTAQLVRRAIEHISELQHCRFHRLRVCRRQVLQEDRNFLDRLFLKLGLVQFAYGLVDFELSP